MLYFLILHLYFLHELSDRTPLYFDITVPRGYGGPLQNIDAVSLHYVR